MSSIRLTPLELAAFLHYHYEQMAPAFGYETREATRVFDADSPNAKLMIAVCTKVLERWHLQLERPKQERFQYLSQYKNMAGWNDAGELEIHMSIEDCDFMRLYEFEHQTRAIASLLLEILKLRNEVNTIAAASAIGVHEVRLSQSRAQLLDFNVREALAAADRLAHDSLFTGAHARYWTARNRIGPCTVCGDHNEPV